MSNTGKMASAVMIGFLVYITARGQLKSYLSIFGMGA